MAGAWLNGKATTGVPPASRGIAYGDGLFETIAVSGGVPRLLPLHLDRLTAGAARLQLVVDTGALHDEIAAALDAVRSSAASSLCHGVLKLIVYERGAARGYVRKGAGSARLIQWFPGVDPSFRQRSPAPARLCRQRLALQPALAGLKHLNRLEQVVARNEWRNDEFVEGLMLDSEGCLVEGVVSNLFLIRGGQLLTPRLDRCGVAGILRRLVMEQLAPSLSLSVVEERLPLNTLYQSDELFLTNSLFGIQPVSQVDCFHLRSSEITGLLLQRLLAWQEQGRV